MILMPLRIVLEKHGFQVFIAKDGLRGLEIARKEHPDLILLDLMLPKIDGFQVLEECKRDISTKHIPVVVISNLGDEASIERALRLGAKEYFVKSRSLLSRVIEYVLKQFHEDAKSEDRGDIKTLDH